MLRPIDTLSHFTSHLAPGYNAAQPHVMRSARAPVPSVTAQAQTSPTKWYADRTLQLGPVKAGIPSTERRHDTRLNLRSRLPPP